MGLFGKNKNKDKEAQEAKVKYKVEPQPKVKGESKFKSRGKRKQEALEDIPEMKEQPIWNLFGENGSVVKALDLIQLKSFANDESSVFLFTDPGNAPKSKEQVQRVRAFFLHKFEKDATTYKVKCKNYANTIKSKTLKDVDIEVEVGRQYALDLVIEGQLSFLDFVKFYQELGNKTSDTARKYLAILIKLKAVLLEVGVEEEDFLKAYKESIKDCYILERKTEESLFMELQGILDKLNDEYEFDDELWEYLRLAITTGQNIKVVDDDAEVESALEREAANFAQDPSVSFEDDLPKDIEAFEDGLVGSDAVSSQATSTVKVSEGYDEVQRSITLLLKTTPAMQFVFKSQTFKKLISELISSSEIKLNSNNITVILGDLDFEDFNLTRETFDEFVASVGELKDDLTGVYFAPALYKLAGNLERNKIYVIVYDYVADRANTTQVLTDIKQTLAGMNSTLVTVCVDCPGSMRATDKLIEGVNHVYLDKDLAYDTLKFTNVMSKMID